MHPATPIFNGLIPKFQVFFFHIDQSALNGHTVTLYNRPYSDTTITMMSGFHIVTNK